MCICEFIAYQCGHRSPEVVRGCPMTTAGHNYPVCNIVGFKPHYAETMCPGCERQLHSRWVLIREWEHRWMHERGICGCEVTFPGLLYVPRVIGDNAAASSAASTAGGSLTPAAEGHGGPSTPTAHSESAENSNNAHPGGAQADVKEAGAGKTDIKQTNVKQTDIKQTDIKRAGVEQAGVEQTDLKEASVKQVSVKEANLHQAAVDEANVREAGVKQTVAKHTNAEQTDVEESDVKHAEVTTKVTTNVKTNVKTNAKETGVNQADVKQTDVKRADVKQADVKQTDVKRADVKQADAQQTSFKKTGAEQTNVEAADVKEADDKRTDSEHTDVKQTTKAAANNGSIPALFSEGVTNSGERRVAIRLAGLYAAEWQADHRALHESGKCHCPTTFTPYQPQIPDEQLTPTETAVLRRWRQLEDQQQNSSNNKPEDRDIDGQVDETMRRIAEIESVFGKFTTESESPKVNLPRRSGSAGAEAQGAQGSGVQGNRRPNDRRFQGRRETRGYTSSQNYNPPAQAYNPAHGRPLVVTSQPSAGYGAGNRAYNHPYQLASATPAPAAGYPFFAECSARQQPLYFLPAHPAYATPATYTDTIPHGASPWQGVGPYRTGGMFHGPVGSWCRQGPAQTRPQGQVSGRRRLPAPGQAGPTNPDKGRQSEWPAQQQQQKKQQLQKQQQQPQHRQQQQDLGAVDRSTASTPALPFCGIPMGAGPEGAASHMPSWLGCRLRRASRSANALRSAGGGEGETAPAEEKAAAEEEAVRGGGAQDNVGGDDGESDRHVRPCPPRRRYSAST